MKKIISLTIACLFLEIVIFYFLNFLNTNFFHFKSSNYNGYKLSQNELFLIVVIIAPIIETYIAQFALMKFLKIYITNQIYLLIIASTFFGIMHNYNWLYMLVTFFLGLILNYYYLEVQKISKYSFFLTALLHSLYNLYGFLFVV